MKGIFYKCFSLISLNLFNIKINNVNNMNSMFYKCFSLTSLNLFNFNNNNVKDMIYMFNEWTSLTSLIYLILIIIILKIWVICLINILL